MLSDKKELTEVIEAILFVAGQGIEIKDIGQFSIAGLISNDYVESQLIKDAEKYSLAFLQDRYML